MNVTERLAIEEKIVRHLCDTMRKHGWIAIYVDDGGDEAESVNTTDDVVDAVFAVAEATIAFRKGFAGIGHTCTVLIVLGNDGYDCIANYSYTSDFDQIMKSEVDPFVEQLEAKA